MGHLCSIRTISLLKFYNVYAEKGDIIGDKISQKCHVYSENKNSKRAKWKLCRKGYSPLSSQFILIPIVFSSMRSSKSGLNKFVKLIEKKKIQKYRQ